MIQKSIIQSDDDYKKYCENELKVKSYGCMINDYDLYQYAQKQEKYLLYIAFSYFLTFGILIGIIF